MKRVPPTILLLSALMVVGEGSVSGASAPSLSKSSLTRRLASIEKTTGQIRQLRQLHAVKAVFPSDKTFNSALGDEMRLDNPETEVQIGQRESMLLGLLKKGDDLHRIIFQSLGQDVLGFYDYRRKILYVRNHTNQVFGAGRYAIAHEYTHALQDQHYNLQKLLPDLTSVKYRNSDAESARHALTEGDAVTTQNLFISRTYTSRDVQALIKLQAQQGGGVTLPKAIKREFFFPYDEASGGVAFASRLFHDGGMRELNSAYRRLPTSTYEIMHPSAYLKHWRPVPVTVHGVLGFSAWKQVDDDVFGAFGYNLVLWQFLSKKTADAVTNSYRGDRYIFLENGDQDGMLFKSVWSSSKTAAAAKAALLSALRVRYGRTLKTTGKNPTSVTEPDGSVYFKSSGNRLTMAFAPTVLLAQQLGVAPTT